MSDGKRVAPAQSSAAEKVAGVQDLVHDILSRLPVKHLNRCKSVSKQWASLISDIERARLNPNTKLVLSGFFFYNSLTKSQSIDSVSIHQQHNLPSVQFLDKIIEPASVKIVQSVGGLFLCSLTGISSKRYCICNPTTSFYKFLPQPQDAHQSSILGCNLVFDPSISPHYRAIYVQEFRNQRWRIDMYSSEHKSWRQCVSISKVPWGTNFENGVSWNGGIHWDTYRCTLLSYDVESGSMMNLPLVPMQSSDRKGGCSYFGESNGS